MDPLTENQVQLVIRLINMRTQARQRNKRVPNWQELLAHVRPDCPHCGIHFNTKPNRIAKPDSPSLQHWENGSISIICQRCNSQHGHMKKPELFRQITTTQKYCAGCNTIHLRTNFHACRTRGDKLSSKCKECSCRKTQKQYQQNKRGTPHNQQQQLNFTS